MQLRSSFPVFLIVLLYSIHIPDAAGSVTIIVRAFENISVSQPVDLQHAGDGSNRIFVVSQQGQIYVFPNDQAAEQLKVFLDISDRLVTGFELGLLGLAFHPEYQSNGYFFVHYTANNPRRNVISRFSVSETDMDSADAESEQIMITQNQPLTNHNGGQIAFGPDGYLYISIGDGGGAGDPGENGQNPTNLLGTIVRIDIDSTQGDMNYAIPSDNPFVGNMEGWREEIFAYGLRNPWRFSFDSGTGLLYAGDVGQSAREEVNIIESGKNYGWNIMEGTLCYPSSAECDTAGLALPIWEYEWGTDGRSITGGYVYRGQMIPFDGWYFFADYQFGNVWALHYDGDTVSGFHPFGQLSDGGTVNISSFGLDEDGEIYLLGYNNGRIYRVVFTGSVDRTGEMPERFFLSSNYPNPFNPSTTIEFGIPTEDFVTLRIYNILGEQISMPVSRYLSAGTYRVTWDASGLPSGTYIYAVQSGNLSGKGRMLLLK